MGAAERRISAWVDLVGDLLARPTADFPHSEISGRLHETFGCNLSWNWMDPPGHTGYETHLPIPAWLDTEIRRELDAAILHHPILRWFLVSGDLTPISTARVPAAVVTPRGREVVQEYLVPMAAQEQLVVSYRFGKSSFRAFALSRGDRDYTDEELRVAAALRPLLSLLDRQVAAYDGRVPPDPGALTGRELAALRLLADGLTAAAIGSRLMISERTVHRHLQSVYRKLDAHDRLTAVLVARDAGLLAEPVHKPSPSAPG